MSAAFSLVSIDPTVAPPNSSVNFSPNFPYESTGIQSITSTKNTTVQGTLWGFGLTYTGSTTSLRGAVYPLYNFQIWSAVGRTSIAKPPNNSWSTTPYYQQSVVSTTNGNASSLQTTLPFVSMTTINGFLSLSQVSMTFYFYKEDSSSTTGYTSTTLIDSIASSGQPLVGIVINPQTFRQVQIIRYPYVLSADIAINTTSSGGSTTYLNQLDPSIDGSSPWMPFLVNAPTVPSPQYLGLTFDLTLSNIVEIASNGTPVLANTVRTPSILFYNTYPVPPTYFEPYPYSSTLNTPPSPIKLPYATLAAQANNHSTGLGGGYVTYDPNNLTLAGLAFWGGLATAPTATASNNFALPTNLVPQSVSIVDHPTSAPYYVFFEILVQNTTSTPPNLTGYVYLGYAVSA